MKELRKYGFMGANKRAAQELRDAGYIVSELVHDELIVNQELVSTASTTIESPALRAQLVRYDDTWLARIADRERFRNWRYRVPDDQLANFRTRFLSGDFDANIPSEWTVWTPPPKVEQVRTEAAAPKDQSTTAGVTPEQLAQLCREQNIMAVDNWSLLDHDGNLLRQAQPNQRVWLSGSLYGHRRRANGSALRYGWMIIRAYEQDGLWVLCEDSDIPGDDRHFKLGACNPNYLSFLKAARSKFDPLKYVREANFEGEPPPPPVFPGAFKRSTDQD